MPRNIHLSEYRGSLADTAVFIPTDLDKTVMRIRLGDLLALWTQAMRILSACEGLLYIEVKARILYPTWIGHGDQPFTCNVVFARSAIKLVSEFGAITSAWIVE